jgi:uncharacterized protein (DUF983 family)
VERRFRPRGAGKGTGVTCPICAGGELMVHAFCLRTWLACAACEVDFSLAELAQRLDDEAFSALERVVGGRLSDRV